MSNHRLVINSFKVKNHLIKKGSIVELISYDFEYDLDETIIMIAFKLENGLIASVVQPQFDLHVKAITSSNIFDMLNDSNLSMETKSKLKSLLVDLI